LAISVASSKPKSVASDSGAATGGLAVRLEHMTVSFPTAGEPLVALSDLSLVVPGGSFVTVIGPNGCGKSTLLRVIAGLIRPETGRIALGDEDLTAAPIAGDGRVGLAFQQPRLVPWLTVMDNVALPLSLAGVATEEGSERAIAVLERVGLSEAAQLRPASLSGGMAQRAALARALISNPPVLLLDEPFSALDALTREAFDGELQRLWLAQARTVIMVTHSVAEAVSLGDQVAVLSARPGRLARLIPVPLPRPRPAELAANQGAAEIAMAVRAALSEAHPTELAPWSDRAT
jgi:NitT/TauT family transport system ATP-binding protein